MTTATHNEAGQSLPRPARAERIRLTRQLFDEPAVALDRIHADHGPGCQLGVGPMRIAALNSPALMQAMFASPVESFRWAHKYNVIGVRFVVGRTSMIVSDGDDHARRRSAVQTAFARRRLNGWIPMILDRTDAAVDRLVSELADDGAAVDLYPQGRRLILGITLHAFFGPRTAERVDEIGDLLARPQRFIEAPGIKQLPHPIPFTFRAKVRAPMHRLRPRPNGTDIDHRPARPTTRRHYG